MSNLYEHIEELGKHHGFKNITELCKTAGVPRANMTELKMGRSKDLSKATAQKFATALGVSLDEVYGTEKAPTQEGERQVSDDDIMFALWGGSDEMDAEDLADVKRYAAFIQERKRKK